MSANNNGHTNGHEHATVEFKPSEYTDLILPGQGKIEGMTFDSNATIEQAVQAILCSMTVPSG